MPTNAIVTLMVAQYYYYYYYLLILWSAGQFRPFHGSGRVGAISINLADPTLIIIIIISPCGGKCRRKLIYAFFKCPQNDDDNNKKYKRPPIKYNKSESGQPRGKREENDYCPALSSSSSEAAGAGASGAVQAMVGAHQRMPNVPKLNSN